MVQSGEKLRKIVKIAKNGQNRQKWSKMFKKMGGLTLSGLDVPAWAPEGREGRSQEAQRASS